MDLCYLKRGEEKIFETKKLIGFKIKITIIKIKKYTLSLIFNPGNCANVSVTEESRNRPTIIEEILINDKYNENLYIFFNTFSQ